LKEFGITGVDFVVEHPGELAHGDWATNVAMTAYRGLAKATNSHVPNAEKAGIIWAGKAKNPRELAEAIVAKLKAKNYPDILKIEPAGPGFINFKLAPAVFEDELTAAISKGEKWGWNDTLKGKKVMVEYTDPNPFKEFHIGHLMSNAIGESISRIIEASGAEVKRACYQGDVGLHVAKAVYDIRESGRMVTSPSSAGKVKTIKFLVSYDFEAPKGVDFKVNVKKNYAEGSRKYELDEDVKQKVLSINKLVYSLLENGLDYSGEEEHEIAWIYLKGRKRSLELFKKIYKKLGTKFDYFFFESETGEVGKKVVQENKGKVFEESEDALVFRAEKYNPKLHTRVFVNKEGLPTYEAKELGLAKIKYEKFPYDVSIVITGNEVNDYFQVLLEAMRQIFPDLAAKTEHYSHGMLRLPTGKMSSRTGDVITAMSLLDEAKMRIIKNVEGVTKEVAEAAGVAAVKYSILRQAAGRDIIFDFEQSLSFEGDSGPYLQYTHARTCSVLERAGDAAVSADAAHGDFGPLPRLLARFPEIVLRASSERESHHVANYLIDIAREFNSFYGSTQILDGASDQLYKLALTKAVGLTLKNGLWLLGIAAPAKM